MGPTELPELLNLPSKNPVAFTQVDKNVGTVTKKPRLYIAMHARVDPPADQVITTDFKSNLVREFEKFQLRKSNLQAASTQLFSRSSTKRVLAPTSDSRQNKYARLYG